MPVALVCLARSPTTSHFESRRCAAVNEGYLQFWGDRPLPARVTVGCSALALGSCVEIDVIAKK